MPSQIDFAVAVGLFFTFVAVLIVYLINFMSSYVGITITSELRTVAYDLFTVLFTGKGIPEDWESHAYTPVKIGLVTDLYRMPIRITETNGTSRNNITINVTVSFDPNCINKTWNDTVRLYDADNAPMIFQLYNQTFCPGSGQYLNSSDIAFNITLAPSETKMLYIYFSPDSSINPADYEVAFPINASNYTAQTYPVETLSALSVSKLEALRKLDYDEVVRTIGTEYKFKIEISES